WNVAAALSGLRQAGRGDDLAAEFGRRAHVDQARLGRALEYILQVRPQAEVGRTGLVAGRRDLARLDGHRPLLELPFLAAAVHQRTIAVTVDRGDPVGERGEPVVVVAVKDQARFARHAALAHELIPRLLRGNVAA